MLSIIGFILVLIPLVIIHELGHFLFAKLFNVRADAFSVGFGPVIYAKKIGETDFRISAIPLGGYVKLLGEDPTSELSAEEKGRALHHQAPWKRFFIFFGGPLFNFLWAIVVFMAMMAIGEPQISTKIGRILPDSTAAKAGLIAGDKIIAIDGEAVIKLEDLAIKLSEKPAQQVTLKIEHDTQTKDLVLMTDSEEGYSVYGEKKQVGTINGFIPNARMTKIGISNPDSIAAKAGFQTGDEIIAINGEKVSTYEELEAKYDSWKIISDMRIKNPVIFDVKNANGERKITVNYSKQYSGNLGNDFGFHSAELFIEQAIADSPAAKAGLQKGDRLVSVNTVPVRSFFELRMSIQKSGEDQGKVTVAVERAGKIQSFEIIPQVSTERDPTMKKLKQFTIGVMPVPSMFEPDTIKEQVWNPFKLLYLGTARMLDLTSKNLISIGKMFSGQVSVKSLGGPILIGKLAGDSITRGLIDFLKMMGILSIGLGVLNILPIPVLDGGHIVMLGIEAIRGKALSLKQMEIAQQVGLFFILGIMVIVMKNDISRLPIFN
jgi:regulator of sigma E protease